MPLLADLAAAELTQSHSIGCDLVESWLQRTQRLTKSRKFCADNQVTAVGIFHA